MRRSLFERRSAVCSIAGCPSRKPAVPGEAAGRGSGPGAENRTSLKFQLAKIAVAIVFLFTGVAYADQTAPDPAAQTTPPAVEDALIKCASRLGERQHCPANTSQGVALVRSTGTAPCLLGKTWGYDDAGIWVADGCAGEFIAGLSVEQASEKKKPLEHVPNVGFLLYEGEKAEIYFRLFSYARYLNQKDLEPTYTDSFGNTITVKQREDFQLNKFFAPFSGWFMTPAFPLLPLRLVFQSLAGRPRPGCRRGQPQLHVQPLRHARSGNHVAPQRPQYRGAVPLLARGG